MDAGECSTSQPSVASSPAATAGAWAKLVPADSACPEVEVAKDDPVICSLVAPPAAGGEEVAWCEIRRNGGDASSATIRNLSLDAIIVDGRIVAQEPVDIKPGSEIVSGPQKEGHLVYTFEITAAMDHDKNNVKIVLDIENAKCSICLNLWHDVVTVAPCLHNFCNGCFSEWLRRSSNSRDKNQSAACPQCRTAVQSVGRNHFLHNIEEAILQAFSSLQRSDEEIALLESYASVKSNIVLGKQKNQSRKRPFPRSSDEINNQNLQCPQCRNEFGGFRCSTGAAHLQCNGCGGMMPVRSSISIPQKCSGCDNAFCGAYWCSQGVNSSHCNLICNQETFKMISDRQISRLPDTVHAGNPYEKDITERCIQQSGKTIQAVISEWILKFENREIDRSRLQLNNVDAITSRTYICNHCYNKFIDFLLYWFRVSVPRNADAARQVDGEIEAVCRRLDVGVPLTVDEQKITFRRLRSTMRTVLRALTCRGSDDVAPTAFSAPYPRSSVADTSGQATGTSAHGAGTSAQGVGTSAQGAGTSPPGLAFDYPPPHMTYAGAGGSGQGPSGWGLGSFEGDDLTADMDVLATSQLVGAPPPFTQEPTTMTPVHQLRPSRGVPADRLTYSRGHVRGHGPRTKRGRGPPPDE